jgi:hypothetical protein
MDLVADKPKCYVDTGVCKVTWSPDKLRTGSLYVPASLLSTLLYIGLSYEIPGLFDIHFNPLLLLAVGFAPISAVSKQVTENFFFNVRIYFYIYTYIYICTCIYIHIYKYVSAVSNFFSM